MSSAAPGVKRSRGRPKGSKDRVARKSTLANNNDDVRVASPTNSASSTPAPPSKRRASSPAAAPHPNGFTAINVGDRNTSRSGRSLSKTPKVASQAVEPDSHGPALKKRVSARSTSRVSSAETSTPTSTPASTPAPTEVPARKRLPDHGSQSTSMTTPAPAHVVAPSSAPPTVPNGYRSLYGQSPYGAPPMNNGAIVRPAPNGQLTNGQFPNAQYSPGPYSPGPYSPGPYPAGPYRTGPAGPILYTQSQLQFPVFPDSEPPINTIQPAPGSMSAPRMNPPKRTALPEQRRYFAPPIPIRARPITEILTVYQDLYNTVHKQYKSFETYTWNVKVRVIDRNVFVKLAAMRSRRSRLSYMLREIKSLQRTGTTAMLIDQNFAQWPPVMGTFPTWYYSLDTSGLKYELAQRIKSMRMQISGQLGEFERAMFMGQNLRVVKSTAIADEMKWLEIQSQIKEYDSMISRLGDVDITNHLTIKK
ncbi:uncharacterized protein RSE6_03784 [Rhynchosporium secalis]|uniref:Uncharacterized protein n=1 Tax=Rhynchosporium secalis TaxID=38038 RepID=A0A1E1M3M8_RHYSE|nr:uncharacterized protein RSE6_03784 [Rhynchosporium secalis]